MRRAALAAALLAATAVPAHADPLVPSCNPSICLTSTIKGAGDGCVYESATTRLCSFHFTYGATASALLGGSLHWRLAAAYLAEESGSCTWPVAGGGCTSGPRVSAVATASVRCGTIELREAQLYAQADTAGQFVASVENASVYLLPGC